MSDIKEAYLVTFNVKDKNGKIEKAQIFSDKDPSIHKDTRKWLTKNIKELIDGTESMGNSDDYKIRLSKVLPIETHKLEFLYKVLGVKE